MGRWLTRASDISDNSANSSPNGTNGTIVSDLSAALASSVKRLDTMPCPAGCDPDSWGQAVADAKRIVGGGWAGSALALGWSELDLFAVAPAGGDPYARGLAPWLQGRPLRAITADYALAVDRDARFYFNRPRASGGRLMWALGRG